MSGLTVVPSGDTDLTSCRRLERATWMGTMALAWEALGVIYGDIGTSPLYVFSTIFSTRQPSKDDVLGALSLIFWTITCVVLLKYVCIVLLADDDGEGGTFSLYSFLCRKIGIRPHGPAAATGATSPTHPSTTPSPNAALDDTRQLLRGLSPARVSTLSSQRRAGSRRPWWRLLAARGSVVRRVLRRSRGAQLALWGATMAATGMVLGDGVLTPAISVMSAVSGLKVAAPAVTRETVVGVSIAILVLLFRAQRLGTHKVSFTFAPVVLLWLLANAAIACYNLSRYGGAVLASLSPHHIVLFFSRHGAEAWRMLGGVMLCVTGAEALYADLGHFSRPAVILGFSCLVYPCLVLTYAGQAAFLVAHPELVADTFWESVPRPVFYPMLVLATLASVVASQALITGSFSIVANAIRLGAFPQLHVRHTSRSVRGQIYIAEVNWALLLLCVGCVGGFKDTVALGNAYGLTVSSVFLITTCLVTLVLVAVWEVSLLAVLPFAGFFLLLEGGFVSANLVKVPEGGWFTLAVSAGVCYVMTVWWAGSRRRARLLSGGAAASANLADLFVITQPPPPPSPSVAQRATTEHSTPPLPVSQLPSSAEAGTAGPGAGAPSKPPAAAALRASGSIGRLSAWRPVQLALRVKTDGSDAAGGGGEGGGSGFALCPLTRQSGVGIYYSESPAGLPHVMLHFLRNVHVVHDVSIFLSVRVLPLPHVAPRDRLLARQLHPVPNFYQVVARYGYLDKVDHGPQFVSQLVDAIVTHLRGAARNDRRPQLEGQQRQRAGPEPAGSVRIHVAPQGGEEDDGSDGEPELGQEQEPHPELVAIELQERTHPPASGGAVPPAASGAVLSSTDGDAADGGVDGGGAAPALGRTAGSGGFARQWAAPPNAVDEAAVAHLLEAATQGVVYYFGAVRVRPDPASPLLHELLFGAVYRALLVLSYSEVDDWRVPYDRVVELGMLLRM